MSVAADRGIDPSPGPVQPERTRPPGRGGRDLREVTMATSTAACPACGSATTPGRYTCAACGAFLDGVAVAPRSWEPEVPSPAVSDAVAEDAVPDVAGDPLVADGPALDPVEPSWPTPP